MHERVIILDFGSQYTQLIARRIRELHVFCEIKPYNAAIEYTDDVKAIILSGSPFSVLDPNALHVDIEKIAQQKPLLAICYGAQLFVHQTGGHVQKSSKREYGRAHIHIVKDDPIFSQVENKSQVWMSHGDSILQLPKGTELLADTDSIDVAAYKTIGDAFRHPLYALQFHPEVTHSECGKQILENFIINICGCHADWTPESFIEETTTQLREKIGNENVILGLSGGVDSTVAAMLLHQAIGPQLYCIFVDNGLLRKNEYQEVLDAYQHLGLNVKGVDASEQFLTHLSGISDPEQKRKVIGKTFVEIFEYEAKQIKDSKWLAQGTIYPDVIESVSVHGPSVTIKSHHNVGGLPERLHLNIVEPLRMLFKDEVREIGTALNIPKAILGRHPFPGPGLAIRILGTITPDRVKILQEADWIFIQNLKKTGLYHEIWQAGVMLLDQRSVGVMGDERTYEYVVALRAVTSRDGMTADWVHLPYDFLAQTSNDIINSVNGINRVVYDISSKPPATIEWE